MSLAQNAAIRALRQRRDYLTHRSKPGKKNLAQDLAEIEAAIKILEGKPHE